MASVSMAYLVGDRFEVSLSSEDKPLVIGRASKKESQATENVLRLGSDEKTLSRAHARIYHSATSSPPGGSFLLCVLGKKGVVVDGVTHHPGSPDVPLCHGSKLVIGSYTFTFCSMMDAAHAAPDRVFVIDDASARKWPSASQSSSMASHHRKSLKRKSISESVSIAELPMPVGWSKMEKTRGRKGRHVSGLKKYTPVPHDAHGRPLMPIAIGGMRVISLGRIVTDRKKFHAKRYIWPVGYKSTRIYPSMLDPTRKVTYTSEILDAGTEPRFRVTPEDHDPIEAATSSAAWGEVVKRVAKLKEQRFGQKLFTTVSGPEMYGYSHPTIIFLIQKMPGARECERYAFQEFIAKEVAPKDAAPTPYMEEDVMEGGSVL